MSEQTRYALALSQVKGLGLHVLKQLLEHYPTPEKVFSASSSEILRLPKVRPDLLKQIVNKSTFAKADKILLRCQRLGVRPIFLEEPDYPELLKHIHLPPVLVYVMGKVDVLHRRPSVALVGTRRISSYGTTSDC